MNEWKEAGLKKKNYRRGGLEPDPPRNPKFKPNHKARKLFKVEQLFSDGEWWGWSSSLTLEIAIEKIKHLHRKDRNTFRQEVTKYRVINKKTKEVVWEEENVTQAN